MTAPVDVALIRRCQAGDRRAFAELVERYQQMVFNLYYRVAPAGVDIEDLAQDAWLKVYNSLPQLQKPEVFRSWLHRVALNTFHDRMRQKGRLDISIDEPIGGEDSGLHLELPDLGPLPEDLLLESEWQERLDAAIRRLPEPFRLAIVMREVQQMSYEEIAEALEINLGTVKSRIARARERLIADLAGYLRGEVTADA
jgi:RNA polymerase sigma-70 factor (ECF subfamily)